MSRLFNVKLLWRNKYGLNHLCVANKLIAVPYYVLKYNEGSLESNLFYSYWILNTLYRCFLQIMKKILFNTLDEFLCLVRRVVQLVLCKYETEIMTDFIFCWVSSERQCQLSLYVWLSNAKLKENKFCGTYGIIPHYVKFTKNVGEENKRCLKMFILNTCYNIFLLGSGKALGISLDTSPYIKVMYISIDKCNYCINWDLLWF